MWISWRELTMLAVFAAVGVWLVQPDAARAQGMGDQHGHGQTQQHMHQPVPPEYAQSTPPAGLWTSRSLIGCGRGLYAAKCAVCHGERGDGKGPAAAGLALKPPSLRD